MKASFLKWWLIITLTSVGLVLFAIYGGVGFVNDADFTKLSFVIFAIFVYCSVRIGIKTYNHKEDLSISRWSVAILPALGMVGTVIGFIYALHTGNLNVNADDIGAMQAAMTHLLSGMSTALVTTASGLIFSIILKIQILNFDIGQDNENEEVCMY